MMLSPQAARMGTMLRCIGKSSPQRRPFFHSAHWSPLVGSSNRKLTLASASDSGPLLRSFVYQQRWKSTAASLSVNDSDDDEEDVATPCSRLDYAHSGHVAAAQQRAKLLSQTSASATTTSAAAAAAATTTTTTTEPWRINLGRGNNDNAWLTGPRPADDWFTGVAPAHACPGTKQAEPCVCASRGARLEKQVANYIYILLALCGL
jgi:hypothetical protein